MSLARRILKTPARVRSRLASLPSRSDDHGDDHSSRLSLHTSRCPVLRVRVHGPWYGGSLASSSSPLGFATAVATTMVVLLALVLESADPSGDTASSYSAVHVSTWMLLSYLLQHELQDVGRTFLYVHLQSFTVGLRLGTLTLFSEAVVCSCTESAVSLRSVAVSPQPHLPLHQRTDPEEASTSSMLSERLYLVLCHNCEVDDLFSAARPVGTPQFSARLNQEHHHNWDRDGPVNVLCR